MRERRERRDIERAVAVDSARGLAPAAISRRRALPPEEVRAIASSQRDRLEDQAAPTDLAAEIERMLTYWNAVIEDYTTVFEEADSDADRLRAIAGRMQALRERFELLQSFGVLPNSPDVWSRVPGLTATLKVVVEELEARGVDMAVWWGAVEAALQATSLETVLLRVRDDP